MTSWLAGLCLATFGQLDPLARTDLWSKRALCRIGISRSTAWLLRRGTWICGSNKTGFSRVTFQALAAQLLNVPGLARQAGFPAGLCRHTCVCLALRTSGRRLSGQNLLFVLDACKILSLLLFLTVNAVQVALRSRVLASKYQGNDQELDEPT